METNEKVYWVIIFALFFVIIALLSGYNNLIDVMNQITSCQEVNFLVGK